MTGVALAALAWNPLLWNRYVYVGNDPVNFVDPTGLDWKDAVCGNRVARAIGNFLGFGGGSPSDFPSNAAGKAIAFYGGRGLVTSTYLLTKGVGIAEAWKAGRWFGRASLVVTGLATAYNLGCEWAGY